MTHRFQAELKTEHLRALSHLAAQKDVRTYLRGVNVTAHPEVRIAATDGTVVGVLQTHQTASRPFTVLVPNDTIKALGRHKGAVTIYSDDGIDWQISAGPITLTWKADTGVFPETARLFSIPVTGEPAQFDQRVPAVFWKVAKDLGADTAAGHSVQIVHNGHNQAALVSMPCAPDFIGLFMPMRTGGKNPTAATSAPAWAKQPFNNPHNWRQVQEEEELA